MKLVEDVRAAYGRGARAYAQRWCEPHPWMAAEREEFESRCHRGMSLLDVGCGPGNDSFYWSSRGLTTLGIDLTPEMVEMARDRHPGLDFRVCDITTEEVCERPFGGIWAAFVLLHLPKARGRSMFEVAWRLLDDPGLLYLATSTAAETEEVVEPVLGLEDVRGEAIPVPQVRWSLADLSALKRGLFTEEWMKLSTPLPGVPERQIYSAILRKVGR